MINYNKILITFVFALILSLSLSAHNVIVYGYIEDGKICTESTYANGSPVKGGSLRVFLSNGKILVEGKTDRKGEFSIKLPPEVIETKSGLHFEMYAGEGHKAVWAISPEDVIAAENSNEGPGNKNQELGSSVNSSDSMAGKVVAGLASIAIIFAFLYYIKCKLKI